MAHRRETVLVGVVLTLTWGTGAALPIGAYLGGPITFIDLVSTWIYSAMLATLGSVAWLIVRLAPGLSAVTALSWLLAVTALVGAIGNALEDVFHVPNAEYLYGLGFFGVGISLIGLTLALAWHRRWLLAALVGGTLVGMVVMAGHGPPLVAVMWLAVVGWASTRSRPALA